MPQYKPRSMLKVLRIYNYGVSLSLASSVFFLVIGAGLYEILLKANSFRKIGLKKYKLQVIIGRVH